jgi:hypothetical protein
MHEWRYGPVAVDKGNQVVRIGIEDTLVSVAFGPADSEIARFYLSPRDALGMAAKLRKMATMIVGAEINDTEVQP